MKLTCKAIQEGRQRRKHRAHQMARVLRGSVLGTAVYGQLLLKIVSARDIKTKSEPYVTVDAVSGGYKINRLAKTGRAADSTESPQWQETFSIVMCHDMEQLRFSLKVKNAVRGATTIGCASIPAERLITEEPVEGWFDLKTAIGRAVGSIQVKLQFTSTQSFQASDELPKSYFPMRSGCHVKLYQDAHVCPESSATGIDSSHQLWVDISKALNDAQDLVYIVGWSVQHDIRLVRDGSNDETLGELLKRKAEEGVRVLLLVWKQTLSSDFYPPGIMGTHDIETRNYFKGSEVQVVLAPRQRLKGTVLERVLEETNFSHHQKCIIVDGATNDSTRRRLIGFVGGLDLTGGRWDTPEHSLFRTLPNEHKGDFYNNCCSTASEATGPREPWHDVHLMVDGPVVRDLLTNFEERWKFQGGELKEQLLTIDEDRFNMSWKATEDESSWSAQLYRSINSDSVLFDEDKHDCLVKEGEERLFDDSIQRAYIHHIRKAKRFIYIENQYFMGSCSAWIKRDTKDCPNLIPLEITARIIHAIRSGEEFRVYIAIPLHPDGDPTSAAVQEMLNWQTRTMEMMYVMIAKTIQQNKLVAHHHPTDYLSFFCLGKQESPEDVPESIENPRRNTYADKARQHNRFMIYIHSKLAIFDDQFIIMGSANINQRSLDGNRDTEIALGANQPNGGTAIRDFRLSLWAEHCGKHMKEHDDPGSIACMKAMKFRAQSYKFYIRSHGKKGTDCHLLTYPLKILPNGKVATAFSKTFIDSGGSIMGKDTFLPDGLTT